MHDAHTVQIPVFELDGGKGTATPTPAPTPARVISTENVPSVVEDSEPVPVPRPRMTRDKRRRLSTFESGFGADYEAEDTGGSARG